MARRPDDTRGTLIFQEGKCIEGEYYIIAVYDDPASCPRAISFCAYELETDCTYTYPLTYNEFDLLFKYDSELMNPSNQDGRFSWVIKRLDFVQNSQGQKILCLAQEPTPEEDDDDLVAQEKPKAQSVAPAAMGGKVDPATRVKLLKELDTQDDHKLHVQLVKSEDARKRFISKLQSQRLLQIEKASQRLLKIDEEREARLVKLDEIKRQQAEKARELKEKELANKSTVAQLELLMKQKEKQAIRRLIQEKDEANLGMGREKDAAKARRHRQERSAFEVEKIEKERQETQKRKRADQVEKRVALIAKRNRQVAEKVREVKEMWAEAAVTRRDNKDQMIQALWKRKSEERQELVKKREEFEAMEEVRERMNLDRDRRRGHLERDQFRAVREYEAAEKEEIATRRREQNKEYLLQWKIDASNRSLATREQRTREAVRDKKIFQLNELRLRKFREQQFLETAQKNRTLSPQELQAQFSATAQSMDNDPDADLTLMPGTKTMGKSNSTELAEFQKSFEQQERERRHLERMEKRKLEEAKEKKMTALTGPDPLTREMQRVAKWQAKDAELKDTLATARKERELKVEKEHKEATIAAQEREEIWDHLEKKRRDRSREKERLRNEAVVARTKALPVGCGMPRVLVF
eukprot:TRINITY_DN17037_c0_g1_i1.p1 TRINITY_DN17037_c0_g1~~TRINITY_DN17037_c0_g1_i1.p1  ORF type:complete len:639 (-),score=204.29 TRINITY_DN17037_c0_g1_i1:230-2146(-)